MNFVILTFFVVICGDVFAQNEEVFLFPDDDRLNTLLPWMNGDTRRPPIPIPSEIPTQRLPTRRPVRQTTITPTNAPSSTSSSMTTKPSPEFIRCMKLCPATPQYDPICGTDQMVYFNEQRLACARACGSDVQMAGRGNCQSLFGRTLGQW